MTPAPRPSAARFGILALVFAGVMVNYVDRGNLSLVAPALAGERGFSPVEIGWLLSAFGWTYALAQLPGGWLVDRIAPRWLYAIAMAGWSVATWLQALAPAFASLFLLRLAVGALEAPSFPLNNRVITRWFPQHERGRAITTYVSGQFLGVAAALPLLGYLQAHFGWRTVFAVTALFGLACSVLWLALYRDPPRRASAPMPAAPPNLRLTLAALGALLRSRNLRGVFLGHACVAATLWFFLTWFPTYLVTERHMGYVKMGVWSTGPYLAAFVGVIASGWISDWLLRRGVRLEVARKVPLLTGLVLSTAIVGANYATSEKVALLFFSIAFFGNGLSSVGWTFVSALAPPHLIGVTGALFNLAGNCSAILVPIVVGLIVRSAGFAPALVFVGGCAVLGLVAYGLIVRDLRPIAAAS